MFNKDPGTISWWHRSFILGCGSLIVVVVVDDVPIPTLILRKMDGNGTLSVLRTKVDRQAMGTPLLDPRFASNGGEKYFLRTCFLGACRRAVVVIE
jgi:hypothetical protein